MRGVSKDGSESRSILRAPRKSAPRRVGKADSIAALADAVGAIAGGDRQRRLPLGTAGGLRRLAKSVNAIVGVLALKERLLGENIQSLQTANRELREAQDTLLRNEKLLGVSQERVRLATQQLDLVEARNAVAIAKAAGAKEYAAESLAKAEEMLALANSD